MISLNYKGVPIIGLANYPVLKKYYYNASDKIAYVVDHGKKRKGLNTVSSSVKLIRIEDSL